MQCPLCEGKQFQDHGKTVNGDRKYSCLVCHTFFTGHALKIHADQQRNKFRLPEINFINSASDRLKYNVNIHPLHLISQLLTTTKAHICSRLSYYFSGEIWEKEIQILKTRITSRFYLGLAIALILHLLLLCFPLAFWMDIAYFKDWSIALVQNNLSDFYNASYCDYPPAYLYVLWLTGKIYQFYQFFDPTLTQDDLWFIALIKLPSVFADIGAAWLIAKILKPHTSLRISYQIALIYAFNPVTMFVSAVWAQIDGIIIFLMLGAFYLIQQNYLIRAGILIAITVIVKPQGFFLVPFLFLSQWFRQAWWKWLAIVVGGLSTIWLIILPFYGIKEHGIVTPFLSLYQRLQDTANRYDFASLNAFNIWGWANWKHDSSVFLGMSYKVIGLALFGILIAWLGIFLYQKRHFAANSLAAATLLIGCFMLPTRMHERYMLYALAFLAIASAVIPTIKWIYWGFTFTGMINIGFVYLRYNQEAFFFSIPDIWTQSIIYVISSLNVILFIILLTHTFKSHRLKNKPSYQYVQNDVEINPISLILQLFTTTKNHFYSNKGLITISILYQITLIAITSYQLISTYPNMSWEDFLNRFSYNDSHHYIFLSQHGYQSTGEGVEFIVFPPFYPLLIYLFTFIFGNPYLASLVISNVSSIIGHAAFAMFLLESGFHKRKVWKIMILLFLTPISIYFNMIYTEGIFLASTGLFLYFLEKRYYSLAVIAGFCAALTRSLGVFCLIPYLAHCIEHKVWQTRKDVLIQALIIPMGTLIYLAINVWLFNDPFYYNVFMKNIWNKELVNPLTQYIYNIESTARGDWIDSITIYTDQAATLILPIVVILYVVSMLHKQKRISYGLLSWSVAQWIVIASQSFWLSNTRYISLVLPFYIMLEEIVGKFRISYLIIVITFASLAVYGIDLFTRSQWLY
jgi:Gpi18-like mannosyltransferase